MGREGDYVEIPLQSLSKEAICKIAQSMLKGKVSSTLVDKLAAESAGNPLFAVESLRMQFENGCLTKEVDEWKLSNQTAGIPK